MKVMECNLYGLGIYSVGAALTIYGTGGGGTIRVCPLANGGEASIGFYKNTNQAGGTGVNCWVAGMNSFTRTGFTIGNDNTPNQAIFNIADNGNVSTTGRIYRYYSPALPVTRVGSNINYGDTLTMDHILKTILVTFSPYDNGFTVPHGALVHARLSINQGVDWTFINNRSINRLFLREATNHILVGNAWVDGDCSGRFYTVVVQTNIAVTYRLS